MLALEPNAQVTSSTEVRPGVLTASGAAIGQLDWDLFVSQDVVFEWLDWDELPGARAVHRKPVDTIAGLISYSTEELYDAVVDAGFLQDDPADSTRFQVLRKLHVVYPADPADPKKVKRGIRLPLAVLVHGNHATFAGGKAIPNHMGYVYLQDELASHGIVSVSVDTNAANALNSYIEMRAESVLGALDQMRAMDSDSSSIFHRRLDFDRVGLMGHSRGGDAVVKAAILNGARPSTTKYNIRAVCSLAPTDFTGTALATERHALKDGHARFYAVLYGALDGDVSGAGQVSATDPGYPLTDPWDETGTGFRHYDRAAGQKAMVVLDDCNHNRFNRTWSVDEDVSAGVRDRGDHEKLANEYIGGLFRWHLLGRTTRKSLFDGTSPNSLGTGRAIQWSFGRKRAQLDEFEPTPKGTLTPSAAVSGDMELESIAITGIRHRTCHQTSVLVVKPSSSAVLVYKLSLTANQDWSQFEEFTFRVCADADLSSVDSTTTSELPNFALKFSDSVGGSATVLSSSLETAERPRRPVFHELSDGKNYTVIRLETLAVDLATLVGVDRTQMALLEVYSPASFAKHQFFDSFQLIKK